VEGRRYYLEMIAKEQTGDDFFEIGVVFPDGQSSMPIARKYLSSLD